jgi:dihydroxy-acid dehydratase
MSGTGFGTVVLHVSPEAATGGNFAVIKTGDIITLDVPNRTLNVSLSEDELLQRRLQYKPLPPIVSRGYVNLYINHVQQAHLGADMDYLVGGSGSEVSRDSH